MLRIFILEDDQRRIDYFISNMDKIINDPKNRKIELTIVSEVEEAKLAYKPPYDILFLDHDLGGNQMVDSSDPNTGYQFAKWLYYKKLLTQEDSLVYVHSLNPVGRQNIINILPWAKPVSIFNF